MEKKRCKWCLNTQKMIDYHDKEWGTPIHDDNTFYEFIFLESMQCGLTWNLMIEKREIFSACYANFDYKKVADFDDADVERIFNYSGMIKSKGKIIAEIGNARSFKNIVEEFGSFDKYIWGFTDGQMLVYKEHQTEPTDMVKAIAKDLKKRGFKYLGPVTTCSFIQAAGLINDHDKDCFKYTELINTYPHKFVD